MKSVFAVSAFAAVATVGFAQQREKAAAIDFSLPGAKERVHARMAQINEQVEILRNHFGPAAQIEGLLAEYRALSSALGGDEPVKELPAWPPQPFGQNSSAMAPNMIVNPVCSGAATTTNFPGVGGAITPPPAYTGTTFTAAVSTADTYLWDVNLNMSATHTWCSDLDITLESPAGTIVTISTDNASSFDNCFNGTLWDDNVNAPATDFVYANNVVATPLSPEGRLQAFRGEDPNGTWKLKFFDDTGGDSGNLSAWSLDISTLSAAPVDSTTNFADSPALAIADNAVTSDTQLVSGVGTYLSKVVLEVEITHTENADLDIRLISPGGTSVIFTTDNGGTNDNVFGNGVGSGTTLDPDLLNVITDNAFVNNTVLVSASPEGAFDNFLGQDPNGTWTLQITDDLATDVGTLVRWELDVTTIATPTPSAYTNFAGTTGVIPDNGSAGPPSPTVFTVAVSGVGSYLWDVDLTTAITGTSGGDMDATLTSPSGTVVTITTDNGGTLDNVFNGTLWDDNANDPATDKTYTNLVTATPLSPEGRLSAFRGEDPNGTWTLTVTDDAVADNHTLSSWSLDISTASAPTTATTNHSSAPGIAIPTTAPPLIFTDNIVTSGLGTSLVKVEVEVEITHTFGGDLDIKLTSPAGTTVAVCTNNGGLNDNTFGDGVGNGTRFDPSSPVNPSDYVYANLVVATLLAPEGAFDNFTGQDPNGTWTLTVADEANLDGGTWIRWELDLTTCATPVTVSDCQIAPTVTQVCDSVASFSGTPSATSASPFTVTFGGLNAQVNGVVFYGISGPTSLVWTPQSFLCVKPATQRLNGIPGAFGNTNGTIGLCDGQYSFNFNDIIQGVFPGLLGTPMGVGQQVDVQTWQRDPAQPTKTTQQSDALSFQVGP